MLLKLRKRRVDLVRVVGIEVGDVDIEDLAAVLINSDL